MTAQDVKNFRTRHQFTVRTLAEILGVTDQAVKFWESGERAVPPTTARLLKLFDKYPQLMKEF